VPGSRAVQRRARQPTQFGAPFESYRVFFADGPFVYTVVANGPPGSIAQANVVAAAEALSGPTTPPGARVQLLNPPGSEVGPGQVATWGKATANQVDAHGFQWNWAGKSSKHIPFDWTGPA
jgi:hypothetical protein